MHVSGWVMLHGVQMIKSKSKGLIIYLSNIVSDILKWIDQTKTELDSEFPMFLCRDPKWAQIRF